MPITDVIPEHDELAMASHGRGFWVLDNVAPLRQIQPGTTGRDLVLFEPAAAYRSANGVVLSWWLADEPGDATLEIMNASGEVVRTFEPAVEGEERDRWAGPALPMEAGLSRLRWDLRTDPPATFPGMILLGRAYDGARGSAGYVHVSRATWRGCRWCGMRSWPRSTPSSGGWGWRRSWWRWGRGWCREGER